MAKYLNSQSASKIVFLIVCLTIFLSPRIARRGNLFLLDPCLAAGNIVINEFFINPAGDDTGREWIELYNPTGATIDLAGWQIGAGKYFVLPSFSFAPNSFLVIRWRAEGQNTTDEIFTGAMIPDTNIANNSGFVALFNSGERNKATLVDYVEYGKTGQTWESAASDAGIWTKGQFLPAPEENQSLRLKKDGQDSNSVNDWEIYNLPLADGPGYSKDTTNNKASPQQENQPVDYETTPNQTNEILPDQPIYNNFSEKIFINEFMPYPSESEEWIELISREENPIDLGGWKISDSVSSSQKIPAYTILSPDEFLTIKLNRNILNNDGDEVRLFWPDGQLVHSIAFEKALKDWACAKLGTRWSWTQKPTPGAKNEILTTQDSPPPTEKAAPIADALREQVINFVATPKTSSPAPEVKNAATVQELTQDPGPQAEQTSKIPTADEKIASEPTKEKFLSPAAALAAVGLLAALAAIGFVYFKRRLASPNQTPPAK